MGAQTPESSEINERIEKLEKRNWWLIGAVVLALAAGGAALFLRVPKHDFLALAALLLAGASLVLGPGRTFLNRTFGLPLTISARAIELRDRKGKRQGLLAAVEDGALLLFWLGSDHILMLAPGAREYGPSLYLEGLGGKGRAELQFIGNEPSIVLSDANGQERIRLDLNNGTPSIRFQDATGTTRAELEGGTHNGDPGVLLRDADGKLRAYLYVDKDGPNLIFSGADGTPQVILGPDGPVFGF